MTYVEINPKQFCEDLSRHVAEVIFVKLNGETRKMRCTLIQRLSSKDT